MSSAARKLFAIDSRALAAFRILLSLVLLADLGIRAADLVAMYTNEGMFSRATICRHYSIWNWSFHFGSGSWPYQAMLFAVAALFASALLVGYETRLATVASWLMLVSLHNRVPHIISGADNLARLLLFWGMFLPLGGVWSVDAWLAKRKGIRRSDVDAVTSVATAAILLQVAFVYLFSAIFKSNADWLHGQALSGILTDGFYGKPIAVRFVEFPSVLAVLTVGTLAIEWLGPLLLFSPIRTGCLRLWVVGLLASMHVGVAIMLNVGLFSVVSIAGLLLFLPPFFWDKLRGRARNATVDSGRTTTTERTSLRAARLPVSFVAQGICALALAFVVFANINGLPSRFLPWTPVPKVELLTVSCGLGQKWDMFAEAPPRNGWCVARATLADGTQVDLLRQGATVDWERPHDPAAVYPNHRWRKCFIGLSSPDYQVFRQPVAEYLCRDWNRGRSADKRVSDFVLVFCMENKDGNALSPTPSTIRETLVHLDLVDPEGKR